MKWTTFYKNIATKTTLKTENTNNPTTKAIETMVKECPTKKTQVTISQGSYTKHLRNRSF